ncbi:regulatory protein, luxR family [Fontimonas thermophila]|uniref:Regulatory protein, luxR family n=1 Tax=Fontimonas thermophila TaxID=1076937 RepID=A0A1I2JQ77_9GAMM|nr:helix-turn-helix transcriptional regulator [Fontimonas thermophila]SFF54916.1 regulatory protein, luxR family [Fontimonas thermophila]
MNAGQTQKQNMQDVDRLIQAFYTAAFEHPWQDFRPHTLQALCQWSGARAAAWLTRSVSDLPGEYAAWPSGVGPGRDAVAGIRFDSGVREVELDPVPPHWCPAAETTDGWGLALAIAHRDTPMRSVFALVFGSAQRPPRELLRRAIGHLAQAGTLALLQFIRRDEWLQTLGRFSRGCAALIDAHGGIYVASPRFTELMQTELRSGDHGRLPFPLPVDLAAAVASDFSVGALHFRIRREGDLYLLHARRPHPLDVLSPREREIAGALAAGKTFKTIARECDIASSTVANHASRIYKKLGIYRREELVGLLRRSAPPPTKTV